MTEGRVKIKYSNNLIHSLSYRYLVSRMKDIVLVDVRFIIIMIIMTKGRPLNRFLHDVNCCRRLKRQEVGCLNAIRRKRKR